MTAAVTGQSAAGTSPQKKGVGEQAAQMLVGGDVVDVGALAAPADETGQPQLRQVLRI